MSMRLSRHLYFGAYLGGQNEEHDFNEALVEALIKTSNVYFYTVNIKGNINRYVEYCFPDTYTLNKPLPNHNLLYLVNGSDLAGTLLFVGYPMKTLTEADEKKLCGDDIFERVCAQLQSFFAFLPAEFQPQEPPCIQEVVALV